VQERVVVTGTKSHVTYQLVPHLISVINLAIET